MKTIDPNEHTLQEVLDFIYARIKEQGGPSVTESGKCLYRHPDGLRACAAGWCIPDDQYSPDIEGRSVRKALAVVGIHLEPTMVTFLHGLQYAHDSAADHIIEGETKRFWSPFDNSINKLVKQYNLESPVQ